MPLSSFNRIPRRPAGEDFFEGAFLITPFLTATFFVITLGAAVLVTAFFFAATFFLGAIFLVTGDFLTIGSLVLTSASGFGSALGFASTLGFGSALDYDRWDLVSKEFPSVYESLIGE